MQIVVTSFDLREFILTKKELEKKLAAHRHELRKMGVASLAVFCSVARNESTPPANPHRVGLEIVDKISNSPQYLSSRQWY
jgi:hypothetical protein